jgi:two-component system phosphate regulon sensor histidine kinase PhoR
MSRLSVLRSRFFWKIYATFAGLFLANSLIVGWIVNQKVGRTINGNTLESLKANAEFLVPHARQVLAKLRPAEESAIKSIGEATGTRVTVIEAGGHVVEESDREPHELDNHWDRPEVQTAVKDGFGMSERYSNSLKKQMLYLARAVKDEETGAFLGIVRVSLPAERLKADMGSLQFTLALVAWASIIVALAIGWTLAKRITVPVSQMVDVAEAMRAGQYERKVVNLPSDELGRLGDTLNRLGSELTGKIDELHRLENVRRDFVANVSHEIKTPLTSIKGYVETLIGGAIDDAEHRDRFLEKIDRNATRLTNLVQDILSLARIEAAEDQLKATPVEWNQLVASVVARHEDAAHAKRITLKVDAQPHVVALGDKEAMIQVLENLLSNAIKYTPDGGRVVVSLAMKASWAKLEVEDSGIGIPKEHLDRIFERFYRVDKARSRELGGTGLGLSIVKHLVQAMGGEVGVESTVGSGTRFYVRLRLPA